MAIPWSDWWRSHLGLLPGLDRTNTSGPGPFQPSPLRILGEPAKHEAPAPEAAPVAWTDGWWSGAQHSPAHPGRVGGPIKPLVVVVHTTDMHPRSFGALLSSWRSRASNGACAHFLIGRTPQDGAHQLVAITRNGNHAGGQPGHGWYTSGGRRTHPNLIAVGIEMHCAGLVRRVGDAWRFGESPGVGRPWAPYGPALPDEEVVPDVLRPKTHGWHQLTAWQYVQLGALLDAIRPQLGTAPPDLKIAPNGVPHTWGGMPSARLAGHCTLDPDRKTDPGPQALAWLRSRSGWL